jgi:hypothetical protein
MGDGWGALYSMPRRCCVTMFILYGLTIGFPVHTK